MKKMLIWNLESNQELNPNPSSTLKYNQDFHIKFILNLKFIKANLRTLEHFNKQLMLSFLRTHKFLWEK